MKNMTMISHLDRTYQAITHLYPTSLCNHNWTPAGRELASFHSSIHFIEQPLYTTWCSDNHTDIQSEKGIQSCDLPQPIRSSCGASYSCSNQSDQVTSCLTANQKPVLGCSCEQRKSKKRWAAFLSMTSNCVLIYVKLILQKQRLRHH